VATGPLRLICLSWIAALIGGSAYGDDLGQVAGSPFRIQAYVQTHKAFNAGDLWKALGLPPLVSDPNFPKDLVRGFDCQPDLPCEAWLDPVQLSWAGTRFVALRFTQPTRQLSRYLLFQEAGTGWKLVGHIDSGFAKYFDPVLYPKELGSTWWLVLREQSGSGTGYHEWIQRWFEMKEGHLREVFSILDEAYLIAFPGDYVRRPAAIVTDYQRTKSGDLIRVLYRLAFTLVDNDGVDRAFFGSIEKPALYRRNRNETTFRLDATEGASENDINRVFRPWPPSLGPDSATDFLRYNLQNLLRIAGGPGSTERQWLEENLKDFPASAERRELMRALTAGTAR
jgi:hypothetical protein